MHYVLDTNGEPVKELDLIKWASRFNGADRILAQDKVGDVNVSTVFLGIDHSFGDGPPVLWETMIFGGKHDQFQERCSTWDQAEQMHKRACQLAGLNDD